MNDSIATNLAAIRERRGLSAAALAAMIGVSRQTIYAVEAGSYIPNTAVALRLARAFDVSVGDLFSLAEEPTESEVRSEKASLLPVDQEFYPGQAVQLCEVGGKLIAVASPVESCYLPSSDGVISDRVLVRGKGKVEFDRPDANLRNRLLLAGCDPAMSILSRSLEPSRIELVLVHQNSSQSLSLLKRGLVHIAGTHLREEASGESNMAAVARTFPDGSVAVISFGSGEEGLLVARGNPKRIRGVEDLARKNVLFLNREPGSGSRALLDGRLKALGLSSKTIRGYESVVPGHLAAARGVHNGNADCCLATQVAARVFGLHFIPLESVRYDLVIRKQHLGHPGIRLLFDTVNRSDFRLKLKSTGGYDTTVTGERRQ